MREGKIERISIHDDDVPDWMATLREGGFTDEEIDSMLSHLNATYAGLKKKEFIDRELEKMENEIKQRRGVGFSEHEKDNIRRGIESRFGV